MNAHYGATPLSNRQTRAFGSDVALSLIKELRAASGAPISDCKKALQVMDDTYDHNRMNNVVGLSIHHLSHSDIHYYRQKVWMEILRRHLNG